MLTPLIFEIASDQKVAARRNLAELDVMRSADSSRRGAPAASNICIVTRQTGVASPACL